MKNTNTSWPDWLPKGARIIVKLTDEQRNYILPVFNSSRYGTLDGVALHNGKVTGNRTSLKLFLRRFEFSDLDVTNLIDSTK